MGVERGPAVDVGPGHHADGPAVPCPVHAARDVVPAAPPRVHPAGACAPGRGTGRGEDRRVAGGDVGEGTRLAAETGAYVCFEDEAGQNLRPPKTPTWARRGHTPWSGSAVRARGGSRWPGWCASSRERGVTCSTGPHLPRAQGRAPLDVRSRLRRPDRRRAQGTAGPGHLDLGLIPTPG